MSNSKNHVPASKNNQVTPTRVDQEKKILSPEEEKRLLFLKTDENSASKGSDEILDRLNERASLISEPSDGVIVGNGIPRTCIPKFPREYYSLIYKLKGWTVLDEKFQKKPMAIAKITAYLIYLRFPKGTLQKLWVVNPKIDGKRRHKHHQFITVEGEPDLIQFIKDAIDMMKCCTYWDQFIRRFSQKYGKPWQASLFE